MFRVVQLSVVEIVKEDAQSDLEGIIEGVELVVGDAANCDAPTRWSLLDGRK